MCATLKDLPTPRHVFGKWKSHEEYHLGDWVSWSGRKLLMSISLWDRSVSANLQSKVILYYQKAKKKFCKLILMVWMTSLRVWTSSHRKLRECYPLSFGLSELLKTHTIRGHQSTLLPWQKWWLWTLHRGLYRMIFLGRQLGNGIQIWRTLLKNMRHSRVST